MYNSQPEVVIRLQGQSKNSRKLPQNIVQFVICHLHNIWSWKRAHCPYICSRYIKKGRLYFTHPAQKFYCTYRKQFKIFLFFWKFAYAWKSISHCKLFEVIWFYIVLCLGYILKLKGPFGTYFCFIL